jgi:hypothetical protein
MSIYKANKVIEKNYYLQKKEKRLVSLKKTAVLEKTDGLIVHVAGPKDRSPTPRRTGPSF